MLEAATHVFQLNEQERQALCQSSLLSDGFNWIKLSEILGAKVSKIELDANALASRQAPANIDNSAPDIVADPNAPPKGLIGNWEDPVLETYRNNVWEDCKSFRCVSHLPIQTFRIPNFVFCGKWMFEVTLFSSGIFQIGWSSHFGAYTDNEGIGDFAGTYAYDGGRLLKFNIAEEPFGVRWSAGDIITCCLDLENATLSYFQNGKSLGIAYDNLPVIGVRDEKSAAYCPGVSVGVNEKCSINFGSIPFRYPVEGFRAVQAGPSRGELAKVSYMVRSVLRLAGSTRSSLAAPHLDSRGESGMGNKPAIRVCDEDGQGGGDGGKSIPCDDSSSSFLSSFLSPSPLPPSPLSPSPYFDAMEVDFQSDERCGPSNSGIPSKTGIQNHPSALASEILSKSSSIPAPFSAPSADASPSLLRAFSLWRLTQRRLSKDDSDLFPASGPSFRIAWDDYAMLCHVAVDPLAPYLTKPYILGSEILPILRRLPYNPCRLRYIVNGIHDDGEKEGEAKEGEAKERGEKGRREASSHSALSCNASSPNSPSPNSPSPNSPSPNSPSPTPQHLFLPQNLPFPLTVPCFGPRIDSRGEKGDKGEKGNKEKRRSNSAKESRRQTKRTQNEENDNDNDNNDNDNDNDDDEDGDNKNDEDNTKNPTPPAPSHPQLPKAPASIDEHFLDPSSRSPAAATMAWERMEKRIRNGGVDRFLAALEIGSAPTIFQGFAQSILMLLSDSYYDYDPYSVLTSKGWAAAAAAATEPPVSRAVLWPATPYERCQALLASVDTLRMRLFRQAMTLEFLKATAMEIGPVCLDFDAEGHPLPVPDANANNATSATNAANNANSSSSNASNANSAAAAAAAAAAA
eukprot:CAMPEP_0175060358 /NCGR_PEP_ID=MMETSP0052_2-20121109/12966_1 /TAXON_ID=51329 ORGANISM="Polytomella parva, Strain SAG 63-3" /NCGR_SAMPLE_ID=MMETSP0052_2 /ASSEMBLY_ACC=CAM_ASM_000194 /LENGTH=854 /DNA_ID=CAMNT_0016326055 /DNA_START=57 /DNA_END=2617 /DNA_ORIENTATION=-